MDKLDEKGIRTRKKLRNVRIDNYRKQRWIKE
jgi:hypothetical protein